MCFMLKDKYISCLHFETQLNHEKQLILIMIPNGEEWHYLAVKKLYALLRKVTSKQVGELLEFSSFVYNKRET